MEEEVSGGVNHDADRGRETSRRKTQRKLSQHLGNRSTSTDWLTIQQDPKLTGRGAEARASVAGTKKGLEQ